MNQDKQILLDEIKDQITHSEAFVITGYKSLEANAANSFRGMLRKSGSSFEVMKKRLMLKALKELDLELEDAHLEGHVGIIFATKGDDIFQSSKNIVDFNKENEDVFTFLAACVDGQMVNGKDAKQLASMPTKDQLRAEFLGLLEAPMAQTLSVFEQAMSGVVSCLEQKAEKEQG